MNDNEDRNLIERYLLGKLSDPEIRKFEARLDDDREFARKYRVIKTFPEMMSGPGRSEYEKKLAEEKAKVAEKKHVRFRKPGKPAYVALASLLIIGILLLFVFTRKANQKEDTLPVVKSAHPANHGKITPAPPRDTATIKPTTQQTVTNDLPQGIGTAAQKAFDLLNPAEGMIFSRQETIRFAWTQKTDTFTRFYICSESNNRVVYWRGARPGLREFKVPANYFITGKYYWYVGTKDVKRTFTIGK